MTFYDYDPVFRNLTGSASTVDPDAYRAMLIKKHAFFVETMLPLPGDFDTCGVDLQEQIVRLDDLPTACRPASFNAVRPTPVPDMPGLPAGAVVEPPVGTVCGSGTTEVTVRAPLHRRHAFTVRVHTDEDERRDLIAHAAQRRWEAEAGDFTFRGHPIPSDDRCALKVSRAVLAAQRNPDWSTTWECADGAALPLAAADVAALDAALQAHHDAVFARFSAVKAAIGAGTITTREGIDAAMGGTREET